MSGTDLKSRGTTGISSLVALFLNLACENKVFRMNPVLGLPFIRQGYPNIRTVDHWIGGNKAERFPQSR